MKHFNRVQILVASALAGGTGVLAVAVHDLCSHAVPGGRQFLAVGVFGTMAVFSWLRPLIMYIGDQSEAVHLDEGVLVVLLLLVRPSLTVVTFAAATVVAQGFMRRPLMKSAFNFGQVLVSVGAAEAVFGLFRHHGAQPPYLEAAAAALAAAAFFVANTTAVTLVLSATGMAWRKAVLDGLDMRLVINVCGVALGVAAALFVSAYPGALPLVVLPLVILRYTLGGFFRARHDRARLEGLFLATLEANRSMGQDEQAVLGVLFSSARSLLRCSHVSLRPEPNLERALCAPVTFLGETSWLTVAGRSRTEPFDAADQKLLEALAAVATGALSNAALYKSSERQKQHLAAITSSLGEGVCALSLSGEITFANKAAASMLGWAPTGEGEEVRSPSGHGKGTAAPDFLWAAAMKAITTGETTTSYEARFRRADGSMIDVACTVAPNMEEGEPVGAVLVFRDISEHKRLAELTHQAFHDTLTGLPNRRQFLADLANALERSRRDGACHAVLFADIDRFKVINDSLGHSAGDLFLISVAEKLKRTLRPGDKLARLGGDEFTVLLEDIGSPEDAAVVAQRVLRIMREPIELADGHKTAARLSIGIALTSPAKTCDDVLHDADVAMYEAKARGRSGDYCLFEPAMGVRSAERVELEMELRQAIDRNELKVYYQPLFSTFDRRVVSVEALVRWEHPSRGLLAPGCFIDIAEETGLIFALGRTVLEQACQKAQEWKDRLGLEVRVAVNLSARQFQDPGLLAEIGDVLLSTGADAAQLCFEVTESLAVDDVERTNQVLSGLKGLGASVAIDDFGTGHSALGHLANFPTDVVKIDRAFIDGVETDQVKSAIVSAVLAMAKAIGCTTVVEGVETESQLGHLQGLGCSVAQGYLFAKPMPASSLEELFGAAGGHRLGRVPAQGRLNAARGPSGLRRRAALAAVDDAGQCSATVGIA
jgi:diguanylate cyclase (GGDEF)-like protein/PAS domain S-box-containing protein